MVYGQMNEPPGNRLRVALTGLTMAESSVTKARTCCSSWTTSTVTHWPVPKCPPAGSYAFRRGLPAYAGRRNGPSARAYYLDQGGLDHFDPGRVRACGRLDRPSPATRSPTWTPPWCCRVTSLRWVSTPRGPSGLHQPPAGPPSGGRRALQVARQVQGTLQRYKELRDIIAILGMDELAPKTS
jgi:F0F1-type ATP synthase, beta subunit